MMTLLNTRISVVTVSDTLICFEPSNCSSTIVSFRHFALNFCRITLDFTEISSTTYCAIFVKRLTARTFEWIKELSCTDAFYADNRSCCNTPSTFNLTLIVLRLSGVTSQKNNCSLTNAKQCIINTTHKNKTKCLFFSHKKNSKTSVDTFKTIGLQT